MEVEHGELSSSLDLTKVWLRRLNTPVTIVLVLWGLGAVYYVFTTGEYRLLIYPVVAAGFWAAIRKKGQENSASNFGRESVTRDFGPSETLFEEHYISEKGGASNPTVVFRMTNKRILVSPASNPETLQLDIALDDVESLQPAKSLGVIDNLLVLKAHGTTYNFIVFKKAQRDSILERYRALKASRS